MYNGGMKEAFPFTYSGTYELVRESSVNWKIRFLTSGNFHPLEDVAVDIFAVGGGGSSHALSGSGIAAGGGGGYTATAANVSLSAEKYYAVTVGEGGGSQGSPSDGGESKIEEYNAFPFVVLLTANGGGMATKISSSVYKGGAGGSGGGGNGSSNTAAGAGGSDGGNGEAGAGNRGIGQGTTTREFGEVSGTLYGGGGGGKSRDADGYIGAGGAGGGGDGGQPGVANTGGGAGGNGGIGGSGIVIIRNAR